MTKFLSFFWERERQGDKFYYLCLNSGAAPLFSSNINSLLFSNWSTWDNREMVWKHAESFSQRPVNWRRRCRIVRSLLLVLGPQRPYIPRILKPDLHILFTITGFFGPFQQQWVIWHKSDFLNCQFRLLNFFFQVRPQPSSNSNLLKRSLVCTNQRCFAIRALLRSFASDFIICSQFWEVAIHFINFIPWIYSQQKAGNFPAFRLSAPPFRIIVKQLESKDKANCVYRQPGLRVLESFIDHGESKTFTGHEILWGDLGSTILSELCLGVSWIHCFRPYNLADCF